MHVTPPIARRPHASISLAGRSRLGLLLFSLLIALVSAAPGYAIKSGVPAPPSTWPWATVVYVPSPGGYYECAGVLVGPQRVVTAGHCVYGVPSSGIFVIAGTHDWSPAGPGPLTAVSSVELAPGYVDDTASDVAVLTLSTVPAGATPIEILTPSESTDFAIGDQLYLAGFGETHHNDPNNTALQQGTTSFSQCTMGLCTSNTATEPCEGDAGGPVIVGPDTVGLPGPTATNGTWRLVAIIIDPADVATSCEGTTGGIYSDMTVPAMRAFVSQPHALTVSLSGSGAGQVTGAGISCPTLCTTSVADETQVALSATPAAGSSFSGWSGACSGTGTCNPTINSDSSVTATFADIAGRPMASIAIPANGSSYPLRSIVDANFGCTGGTSGGVLKTGGAGCAGAIANGKAIDTASPGHHTLSVTATDTDGQTATTTSEYTVVAPASAPQVRAVLSAACSASAEQVSIGSITRLGGRSVGFDAPEAGMLTIGWYKPSPAPQAHSRRMAAMLVADGSSKSTRSEELTLRLRLTKAGIALLRHGARHVSLNCQAAFTPFGRQQVTVTRSIRLKR